VFLVTQLDAGEAGALELAWLVGASRHQARELRCGSEVVICVEQHTTWHEHRARALE
jgi:hypothetical protein